MRIVGLESSRIHSCTEDLDTPDAIETCRIDTFFSVMILSNNIFILIVFIRNDKLCINMYNKKRGNKNSMTVNERLRYVRKRLLCLTQAELASDMGLTSNTIGVIETKTRNITEQTLKHFCIRYNINEEWMRTGNGKIFAEQNTLDAFAKAHEASKTEIALFKAFLCIEPKIRQTMLEQFKINLNQEEAISNLN